MKDLLKMFPKHPQLLSIGFLKSDWQLFEVEVFQKIFKFLAQIMKNNEKFSKNEKKYSFVQLHILSTKYEHLLKIS